MNKSSLLHILIITGKSRDVKIYAINFLFRLDLTDKLTVKMFPTAWKSLIRLILKRLFISLHFRARYLLVFFIVCGNVWIKKKILSLYGAYEKMFRKDFFCVKNCYNFSHKKMLRFFSRILIKRQFFTFRVRQRYLD